jgi:acyl-CoA dehydrogenase
MDATRALTATFIDRGEKPAVLSGIAKLHITARSREIVNDAMDVLGGKGICMGPSNFLGAAYMQMPVSITVEGANILTRSLIVFGQGAIRCHPYVLREMAATAESEPRRALADFDAALFAHLGYAARNFCRTLVLGVTGSHFARVPGGVAPSMRRYYQQLTRFSSALALVSDVAMGSLGGALKRKEKLSARLGDVLSQLYLCSATLWRFEQEGAHADDAPLAHWAIWDAMFKAQSALEGVLDNFPNPLLGALMRRVVFPLGRPYIAPPDALGRAVARLLIEPSATRDRLTAGMFIGDREQPVGLLERALALSVAAEPIERKLRDALRREAFDARLAPGEGAAELTAKAVRAGVITDSEAALLASQRELAARVVRVDDFDQDLGTSLLAPPAQHAAAPPWTPAPASTRAVA